MLTMICILANPAYAEANDQSFQLLNGILSTVKLSNEFPPSINQSITFYVRTKAEPSINPPTGSFTQIKLTVRTTGGDCRNILQKSFQSLFEQAGLGSGPFLWGKDYFPSSSGEQDVEK